MPALGFWPPPTMSLPAITKTLSTAGILLEHALELLATDAGALQAGRRPAASGR